MSYWASIETFYSINRDRALACRKHCSDREVNQYKEDADKKGTGPADFPVFPLKTSNYPKTAKQISTVC